MRDLTWIVLFDSETPAGDVAWFIEQDERILPVMVQGMAPGTEEVQEIVHAVEEEWVVTTRVDSDDALHRDHLRRVQDGFDGSSTYVEFTHGLMLDARREDLYHVRELSNAFSSLIEPPETASTIWSCWHSRIREQGLPVLSLEEIGWLIVIHGFNKGSNLAQWRHSDPVQEDEKRRLLSEFGIS